MNTNSLTTTQSMKVVPTLEETLISIGLNTKLDENVKAWFNQLKITWLTWKRSPNLEHHLQVFFETNPDRYRIALVFVAKCKDCKDCKPKTLPFFIMESLYKWSCKSDASPQECLKLPAFRIATEQKNQQYLNLVVKTYKIVTIKKTILPLVKNMLKDGNDKLASQMVLAMELYEDIPVEDLLFPLIIQNKYNMMIEYLSECPSQALQLVLFLDNILDKNVSIRDLVQKYIYEYNITFVNYDILHRKPLGKLVGRLCSKFNIPIETCKNLCINRTLGGLRYLIHQKYVDRNVSLTVWDDLIKDTLKENSALALEFVHMLVNHDRNEAAKWSQYFNLAQTTLPQSLKKMSLDTVPLENENWDDGDENLNQSFYELPLAAERIIIINTPDILYELTNTYLVNCNLVSIDSEWKPTFGAAQSQVALIQIAVENNVYLIDTLSLNKPQYSSFWYDFNKSLLDNAEIIKLGFGLEQDLKQIKGSVVGLSNIKVKGEGLLDLSTLWKNLISSGLNLQSSSGGNVGNSLSSLVEICFGYPLRKSEQRSNWEIRPLRETQIQYAAIDAHVLVELYNFLQNKCLEQSINFEEICNATMMDKKIKCVKQTNSLEKTPTASTKTVDDVKFFVESKLINFIPCLRYYGIDTLLIPETLLWHDIVKQALFEERYILLSKHKMTPMKTYPQSSILYVGKCHVTQETITKIKNHFNIEVTDNDFTKRCINCNGSDLEKLSSEKVSELCTKYQNVNSVSNNVNNYNVPADDEYYEKCDGFLTGSEGDEDIVYTPTQNSCVTNTGVPVQIQNVKKLSQSPQAAIICNSCGRVFWNGDDLYKTVLLSVANNSLK